MKIIPAIDILNGKCVRLTQGEYQSQKVYNENPLEVARQYQDAGIKYLHLVDLDGAREGQIVNHRVLEEIATHTTLHIDFGGGVKSEASLQMAFASGAQQVTLGSIAASNRELTLSWLDKYGSGKLILGADARDGYIAVNGWTQTSQLTLHDFIADYLNKGFSTIICTDVSKDGMLQGPATELYQELIKINKSFDLIASGGVSAMEDLEPLKQAGVAGVIIGKAIYEGNISLKQLQPWL